MIDLTIIYYTSNYLDETNPVFLKHTQDILLKAAGDLPIISVSQKPINFGLNHCIGDIGRSHLNIYRQILIGCINAKTKYVALAEDDILYSKEHFNPEKYIRNFRDNVFYYDMNKVSLFTWSKPPMFSFRTKRKVINQLIAPRRMLIDALEERFARVGDLKKTRQEEQIIKYWGDIGRYEELLGVKVQPVEEFYCDCPSIVFSHPQAFGYLNQGKRKRLGDLRIIELDYWGRADKLLEVVWGEAPKE